MLNNCLSNQWVLLNLHLLLKLILSIAFNHWPVHFQLSMFRKSPWKHLLLLNLNYKLDFCLSPFWSTTLFLWKRKSLSLVQLFTTPWTIQFMKFSRPDTGVGSLSLLQGTFPSQESNQSLLNCGGDSLPNELSGKPFNFLYICAVISSPHSV